MSLEKYFDQFRKNIVGVNQTFISPYGEQKLVYSDWTASGRLYLPIEEKLLNNFGPFVANTDTETSNRIKDEILHGCNTQKLGWIRLSIHPTIANEELEFICSSLKELSENIEDWSKDYKYNSVKNEYIHKTVNLIEIEMVRCWFLV